MDLGITMLLRVGTSSRYVSNLPGLTPMEQWYASRAGDMGWGHTLHTVWATIMYAHCLGGALVLWSLRIIVRAEGVFGELVIRFMYMAKPLFIKASDDPTSAAGRQDHRHLRYIQSVQYRELWSLSVARKLSDFLNQITEQGTRYTSAVCLHGSLWL